VQTLLSRRRYLVLWQLAFLLIGSTWLLAPHLNHGLSYRTSLISQYELPSQPYSWLFRSGDFLAGALLFMAARQLLKLGKKTAGGLLAAISIGMMLDPLLSTSCRMVGGSCQEFFSPAFLLHAIETVFTSAGFFAIATYDAWRRRKLVSIGFVAFQFLYGLLFVSQLASRELFNTASQYVYQTALLVWAAWFVRDILAGSNYTTPESEQRLVKTLAAAWAFLNGILAIVISLAHISLAGRIKGLYFTGDSAWLAQHGVIIGVVMIYLSRHLARGEVRARQIFLLLSGVETLKYATISPNAGLAVFYLLTFCALFGLRDDFDRGAVAATWRVRLKDLYVLVAGLLLSVIAALMTLDSDSRASVITARAIDNLTDYVTRAHPVPHNRLEAVLLANSISVFLITSLAAVLWVLFRPQRLSRAPRDYARAEDILRKYSVSSEDYFKLWPRDKEYFWAAGRQSFITYKVRGSIAFALADPIGPEPLKTIGQFNDWCRQRRLKVCYLPVYERSLAVYEKAALESLQIGSSAVIDIKKFLDDTAKDKWWRWRLNKARKNGYEYHVSVPPHPRRLAYELKKVSDAWLKIGGHAERGFALGYFDAHYLQKCVLHYLTDDKQRVIAFANQLPQFNHKSTNTIDLLRYSPDYGDSMAYLLYKTIERSSEHSKYFDLGFVPFAKAQGPLLNIAKTLGSGRFSAQGLERFKDKFDPDWQPNYLVYEGDIADLLVIALNLEKAMES
jgi:lysylphosphatidylglycerol synthetase-like protein (DUF2156 family)